jgi:hypothetical protein
MDNVENQIQPAVDNPTVGSVGTYEAQFNTIRAVVLADLQRQGSEYAMSVQKLVKVCISANLEISLLAEKHCKNILQKFRACRAKLVNHTNYNAMFSIDDKALLVDFDLSKPGHSILCARKMQPDVYATNLDIQSNMLLLKQIQVLFSEQIDDASIAIPYRQCMDSVAEARRQLDANKEMLHAQIQSRANTAFEFEPGLSLYTLNFSDDMSMMFWDRYTITQSTAKSYYIEQHCIIEHTISGDVEPERYIAIHKPSKNNTAQFFADRLACLTSMVRPEPTVQPSEQPVEVHEEPDDNEEYYCLAELVEMGWSDKDIADYKANHPMPDKEWFKQID